MMGWTAPERHLCAKLGGRFNRAEGSRPR
jgi:hypothetical protein